MCKHFFHCLYLCGVSSSLLCSCANVKWHNLKCVDFCSIFRRRRRNVVHATNLNAKWSQYENRFRYVFGSRLTTSANERMIIFPIGLHEYYGNEYGEHIERFATGLRLHWGMSIQSIKYRPLRMKKKYETFSWHRYGCVPATHPWERDGARQREYRIRQTALLCENIFQLRPMCTNELRERRPKTKQVCFSRHIRTNTCRKGAFARLLEAEYTAHKHCQCHHVWTSFEQQYQALSTTTTSATIMATTALNRELPYFSFEIHSYLSIQLENDRVSGAVSRCEIEKRNPANGHTQLAHKRQMAAETTMKKTEIK